jgi:hypothetical protein
MPPKRAAATAKATTEIEVDTKQNQVRVQSKILIKRNLFTRKNRMKKINRR